jgi:hypothetical protein
MQTLLNSAKNWKNLSIPFGVNDYPDVEKVFLSPNNVDLVIKSLYAIHKKFNGQMHYECFKKKFLKKMREWVISHDPDDYELAGNPYPNYVELLNFINRDFISEHYDLAAGTAYTDQQIPDINVYRRKDYVGPTHNRELKAYDEMLTDEYPDIDVWQHYEVNRSNRNYRYNNRIPYWQTIAQKRKYDRSNDGLHDGNPDRASLDNQVRGYDMSDIYKTTGRYYFTDWQEL